MYASILVAVAVALASPVITQARPASPLISQRTLAERPELMVVGTVHLANPRHDVHNVDVDDMLAPARQAQVARLVEALAAWRPTRVAVEWPHARQAELDRRYADYRAGRYTLTANETDQIGLRLAARLDLPRVDAVDWNGDSPGRPSDYDWQAGAVLGHEEARLAAIRDPDMVREERDLVRTHTLAGILRAMNTPAKLADMNRVYFDIALLGAPEQNPGADWVGGWYARNLKIFANLVRLNARPQERILAVYGAGHGFLLNSFAEESHAFRRVRPDGVLAAADAPP